jgi:hypothetical protein
MSTLKPARREGKHDKDHHNKPGDVMNTRNRLREEISHYDICGTEKNHQRQHRDDYNLRHKPA